ncbi:MAG TPA: hypothetical protein VHR67_14145, partial [Aestuariivirgaceae bacterium]|nr:hypothetical protein [Aestuariivirgaceae bacterium]
TRRGGARVQLRKRLEAWGAVLAGACDGAASERAAGEGAPKPPRKPPPDVGWLPSALAAGALAVPAARPTEPMLEPIASPAVPATPPTAVPAPPATPRCMSVIR